VLMDGEMHGAPRWVSEQGTLYLFRTSQGAWTITFDVDGSDACAIARTAALHPNTIRIGEWDLRKRIGVWIRSDSFMVSAEGPNTEERPFDIKTDLGADYFLRVRSSKVVWFRHPSTGEVLHSGAKAAGSAKKLGKRFCPLCEQCFSANNFVSQHLKNMHRPSAPGAPTCVADGHGGANLSWEATGEGAAIVSFFVQLSVDGGDSWSTAIEDTKSDSPDAHVGGLTSGLPHIFRVAALGVAAQGPMSAPSSAAFLDRVTLDAPKQPAEVPQRAVQPLSLRQLSVVRNLGRPLAGSPLTPPARPPPPAIPARALERQSFAGELLLTAIPLAMHRIQIPVPPLVLPPSVPPSPPSSEREGDAIDEASDEGESDVDGLLASSAEVSMAEVCQTIDEELMDSGFGNLASVAPSTASPTSVLPMPPPIAPPNPRKRALEMVERLESVDRLWEGLGANEEACEDELSDDLDDSSFEVGLEAQLGIFREWTRQMKAIGAYGDAIIRTFVKADAQRAMKAARKAQRLVAAER